MAYRIEVLDTDGCSLSETEEETLKAAKATARTRAKDRECIEAGARRVKVYRLADDVCVEDVGVRRS